MIHSIRPIQGNEKQSVNNDIVTKKALKICGMGARKMGKTTQKGHINRFFKIQPDRMSGLRATPHHSVPGRAGLRLVDVDSDLL